MTNTLADPQKDHLVAILKDIRSLLEKILTELERQGDEDDWWF